MIWDRGFYATPGAGSKEENEKNIKTGLEKGHITFILAGRKLKGEFALVKLKRSKEKNAWLLIKAKDQFAIKNNILKEDKSAVSNRTIDEILETKDKQWSSKQGELDLSQFPRGNPPAFIKPMLATLVSEPFDRDGWEFEIKWDGYRAICQLEGKKVSLYTRNNKPLNEKFASIVDQLGYIQHDTVFDGEIVVLDEAGKPDFNLIQNFPSLDGTAVYYLFDLLYLDHHILYDEPLSIRKKFLEQILPSLPNIKFSESVEKEGRAFYQIASKQGLEGIMAKRKLSRYLPGIRSNDWLKIKIHQELDAVILGFTGGKGGRKNFLGSLLLAVNENTSLRYIGGAGTGFSEKDLEILTLKLMQLEQRASPVKLINPPKVGSVHWVRPELVCRVKFQEWTPDLMLRQAVFLGLREDKDPSEVFLEKPAKNREGRHSD
jgi:bifunctional non-homologous end joining protein LigD